MPPDTAWTGLRAGAILAQEFLAQLCCELRLMRCAEMAVDKTTVNELARLAGIVISDDELDEVTNRFSSLIEEMDRLKDLDLANIHPVAIFPEDGEA